MNVYRFSLMVFLCILLLPGCSPAPTQLANIVPTDAPPTDPPAINFTVYDFPKAQSLSLAGSNDGTLYFIYGQTHSLFVARSTDGGLTFSEPILATGDMPVHVLPIEHPAIAVNKTGRVGIAWLEMPPDFNGAKVWYAVSEDGGESFKPGQLVATEPEGEVVMVQIALDDKGNPILAWLTSSELKFSRSFDQGFSFSDPLSIAGAGACECCQPQIIATGEKIFIAYRSLEPGNDKGDIRDAVMIRSETGGETFEPVTRVSDAHWYLPACPIAGPSLAAHAGNFYVSWMDGRFEPPGTFSRGDIWLSMSQDGGRNFSPNIRINSDQTMHHTLPAIAVGPGGRLHIAWEAQTKNMSGIFLYYATSDDGQTFTAPQSITDNADPSRGSPGKPVLFVDAVGHVTLAWMDRLGAHIASWIDTR